MKDERKSGESAATEQFLALAQSAKGKAATMVIEQILAHTSIYYFAPFLKHPNIQNLRGTEHEPHLNLLKHFAYSTYAEYQTKKASLPPLSPPMLTKLKQLSIVSLAAHSKRLAYKDLLKDLEISNVRELEDMIIESMYQGLVAGKLDQANAVFEVKFAVGRDLPVEEIPVMIKKLQDWLATSEDLVQNLDRCIKEADTQKEVQRTSKGELVANVEQTKKAVIAQLEQAQHEMLAQPMGMGRGGPMQMMMGGPRLH